MDEYQNGLWKRSANPLFTFNQFFFSTLRQVLILTIAIFNFSKTSNLFDYTYSKLSWWDQEWILNDTYSRMTIRSVPIFNFPSGKNPLNWNFHFPLLIKQQLLNYDRLQRNTTNWPVEVINGYKILTEFILQFSAEWNLFQFLRSIRRRVKSVEIFISQNKSYILIVYLKEIFE